MGDHPPHNHWLEEDPAAPAPGGEGGMGECLELFFFARDLSLSLSLFFGGFKNISKYDE